jgi:hypothetical protein
MYYSYVEIEYISTSFSPARTNLALELLSKATSEQLEDGKKTVCEKFLAALMLTGAN